MRPDVTSSPGMESSPLAHRNDVMREKRDSVMTSDPMVHWEEGGDVRVEKTASVKEWKTGSI